MLEIFTFFMFQHMVYSNVMERQARIEQSVKALDYEAIYGRKIKIGDE